MNESQNLLNTNGVFVSPLTLKNFADFETNYVSARTKEKRILSIEQIQKLPNVDPDYIHYKEWEIRKKNIQRFLNYLSKKKKALRILDIGCGNGFFTHMMSKDHTVVGLDVNLTELKQAAEAFPNSGIHWYCLDILSEHLPENRFDLITFCASFQYFKNPKALLLKCSELLTKDGEIHIIDSPFYAEDAVEQARQNSLSYYRTLQTEAMTQYYKHNTYSILSPYPYEFLYKPVSFLPQFLRRKDSPFPWIRIKPN